MLDLNLILIQVSLEVSLERFVKIQKIVQIKIEERVWGNKMLETNQIRKKLDNLSEKIWKRVENHIKKDDMTQTREALLRLIYIIKSNVIRKKAIKRNTNRI